MKCKEFEKNIPIFINSTMDYSELKEFVDHVEKCPECREELDIQLLVSEGIARLNDGGALDLRYEMDKRMAGAMATIHRHRTLRILAGTLQLMAALAFALIVVLVLI